MVEMWPLRNSACRPIDDEPRTAHGDEPTRLVGTGMTVLGSQRRTTRQHEVSPRRTREGSLGVKGSQVQILSSRRNAKCDVSGHG
jgi:hypothetical protein